MSTTATKQQKELADTYRAYIALGEAQQDKLLVRYLESPDGAEWIFIDPSSYAGDNEVRWVRLSAKQVKAEREKMADSDKVCENGLTLMKSAMGGLGPFSRISPPFVNAIHSLLVRLGFDVPSPELVGTHFIAQDVR